MRQAQRDGFRMHQVASVVAWAHAEGQPASNLQASFAAAQRGDRASLRILRETHGFGGAATADEAEQALASRFDVTDLARALKQLGDLVAASDATERALHTQLARVAQLIETTTKEDSR